jgi:zinc transport system substrate-binding protein
MKKSLLNATLGLVLILSGCQSVASDRPVIMTTLYPQFSLTEQLVGDLAEVHFLLTPGMSAHSFEPTPSQVVALNEADLVIFTSESVETWIHSLEDSAKGKLIDLSIGVELIGSDHDHHDEVHEDEENHDDSEEVALDDDHNHGDYDPHFWLDPKNGRIMLNVISDELIKLLPNHENTILSRKKGIDDKLVEAINLYEALVAEGDELDLVFGGHNAFGYLGVYHIHFLTPYSGYSDSVLPTADSIASFVNTMNNLDSKILYVTTTDNAVVVDTLKEKFPGLETRMLYTIGNVSKEELETKAKYQDFIMKNYESIKANGN